MIDSDEKALRYLERWINIEHEKRDRAEDLKELAAEAKSAGLMPEEIAGIKLKVKRHFETDKNRAKRESAEQYAEALGALKDTPLGAAPATLGLTGSIPEQHAPH
jgi:uncharacterized protein (UPF0335 family)